MKVHFCDLCNESVPQGDLDAGRAFVRKGRTICAHCEAVMTHAAADVRTRARAHAQQAGEAALAASPVADGHGHAREHAAELLVTADVHEIAAAIPATSGTASAPSGAPVVISRGGAGGVWVGLCALAGLAVTIGVFHDRNSQTEKRVEVLGATLSQREGDVQMLRRQVSLAEEAVRDAERKSAARADLAKERQDALARELAGLRDERDAARTRLAQVEKVAQESGTRDETARLELERRLAEMSRAIAKSEDERRALEGRLLAVELTPRAPAPAAPVPEALKDPAWVALTEGLKSDNSSVRWEAVNQIGEAKDPASVSSLAPLLKDPDVIVRMAVARVLGEIGSKEAVPNLIDALEDPESAMREYTYVALKQLTGADLKFEFDANEAERARRVKAWREWWKKESEGASRS